MALKLRDALLAVALFLLFMAIILLAAWIDTPEMEAHDRWYAEQQTRSWCL